LIQTQVILENFQKVHLRQVSMRIFKSIGIRLKVLQICNQVIWTMNYKIQWLITLQIVELVQRIITQT